MHSLESTPTGAHFSITAYPPSTGGAQVHTFELVSALLSLGNRASVSAFWENPRSDWLLGTTLLAPALPGWVHQGQRISRPSISLTRRLAHVPILPFHYPFPTLTTPVLSRLLQPGLEATIPRNVALIHHVRIGREILAHASLEIARRRGIPFVLTPLHHPRWTGWRYREWIRIYREADLVFALTNQEKSELSVLGVDPSKVVVTGIAPVLQGSIAPGTNIKAPPTVLFLGQHYSYKGWRTLLQAAPIVWRTHPETRFVFAGPDVGDSAKAFRDTDPRIVKLGKVDEDAKVRLLRDCTLLALPSTQESFGGVFTEAWTFGKPVLGCPIPAVSELVQEGANGLLRLQTPEALADGIRWILDHPQEAEAMGRAGQALVQEKFTWPAIAEKVLEGYQAVLEKPTSRNA
jgi:glycosyltransferase involved in cell wall biosynthesis